MRKVVFSDEDLQNIISLYKTTDLGTREIGAKYNVSKTVITRVLKENNISMKDNHKYSANYDYFEKVDTPEKAYWAGFIAADGCVYQREANASVIISIHRKDRAHLEKIKKALDATVNILDFTNDSGFSKDSHSPMSKIVFNSKKMAQDLVNIGIVPRKSECLKPPNIKEEFFLPFILGYYDGDGGIYRGEGINHNFNISFTGTKEIIDWINSFLNINNQLDKRYEDKETYSIRVGGTKKPYLILKQLYDSVNVHLDRKYEIYKNLEQVVLERNFK